MKSITLSKQELSNAIAVVKNAVGSNPITPLLGNILFESGNGDSRMAATNLEMGISCKINVDGDAFRTCIPSKIFSGLVDSMFSEEIELQYNADDQSITLMTEQSTSKVKCVPADEFPDIPSVENPAMEMELELFAKMVQRVAFASKTDRNLSSILSGIYIEASAEKLIMFATDGLHLSYEETGDFKLHSSPFSFVVGADSIESISRVLASNSEGGAIKVQVDENKILFSHVGVDIVTQVMSGKFPDYKLLMPPEARTTITVPTLDLLRACKQLKVFATEIGTTKMVTEGMLLHYSVAALDKGDGDIMLPVAKVGEDVEVGINVHFLMQFLEVCETEMARIQFSGSKGQILLTMPGLKTYYHIIMPIAL